MLGGCLTGRDARELGVPIGTLNALARRGQLDRVEHGIYRVPLVPPKRLDQYKLATVAAAGQPVEPDPGDRDLRGLEASAQAVRTRR